MRAIKNIMCIMIGALIISSCNKKIESYQPDPNKPTSVPSNLILGTILVDAAGRGNAGDLSSDASDLGSIDSWSNVQQWNQYHCQNYNYYGDNIYAWSGSNSSFDPYLVLKNVIQMENEFTSRGGTAVNSFKAVGRFIKAYYFYNLTSMFGDVPLDGALDANNTQPTYTSQQKVFQYVLSQLDSANTDFATLIAAGDKSLSATQDIYYAGNLVNWQKLVNTFKLRVLVSLSKKSSDGTMNVAAQFASIINNSSKYPIFQSQADDLEYRYNPGATDAYSVYPFNPNAFGSIAARYNMAYTYVNALTSLKDPRVYVTCEPAWKLVDSFKTSATDFKVFVGASTGEAIGTMYSNAFHGIYSFINRKRYYSNNTGEPDVLVGYKEMCFNIAEAITRGWLTGNAETWYKKGITESMSFYDIDISQTSFNAYFLPPGATNPVTDVKAYPFTFDFNTYYAQPGVKLSSTATTAINEIVLQKYIAMFENSGYEGYYNWRRIGVPAFQGGVGVGNNGIVPKRWAYPVSEQTQNATNWKAALSNQGFSADDLNQIMWLLK